MHYVKASIPNSESQSEFCHQIEDVNLSEHLPITVETLQQFRIVTAKDPNLQLLMKVVLTGWPDHKKAVPPEVQPYFNSRDELTVQDGLIFKSDRVIIPTSLRRDVIQQVHNSHLGVEGCLCRAREAFY